MRFPIFWMLASRAFIAGWISMTDRKRRVFMKAITQEGLPFLRRPNWLGWKIFWIAVQLRMVSRRGFGPLLQFGISLRKNSGSIITTIMCERFSIRWDFLSNVQ